MKAALLDLVKRDGRGVGEFIRSLIGDAIKAESKRGASGSTTGSTTQRT